MNIYELNELFTKQKNLPRVIKTLKIAETVIYS